MNENNHILKEIDNNLSFEQKQYLGDLWYDNAIGNFINLCCGIQCRKTR